jgi:hypothetical protein
MIKRYRPGVSPEFLSPPSQASTASVGSGVIFAEEALRDNHQLFAKDAQLYLLPEKRGGEVSHGGHEYD